MDRHGLYVAGSDINAGKTTLSLGLISWLGENIQGGVSFMKPLGQKTVLRGGESVGEDTFLVNTSLDLEVPLEFSAPFTMSSGASKKFLSQGVPADIGRRIRKSYRHLRSISEMVVVEGTGHPGVGSVFGMHNASVAGLLDIPVLLVLNGGIGKTIDRFCLCSSIFKELGVPVLGVVINRVIPGKMEEVRKYLDPWFQERGIPVLGYIPYVNSLTRPSLGMLGRELGFETSGNAPGERLSPVKGFIAGFGTVDEILSEIAGSPESALLISSGRHEVVDAIVARRLSGNLGEGPGALVICGEGSDSEDHMAGACEKLGIPLYRTSRNAGDSVSLLNRRIFKVEPGESVKISEIVRTIKNNVDLPRLLSILRSSGIQVQESGPSSISRLRSWISRVFRRKRK